MSELTYISAIQISNYTILEVLQDIIVRTIARWFDIQHAITWSFSKDGGYELCGIERIQSHFELCVIGENVYQLSMYGVGRFRRHGSSCDYFEKLFNCLTVQILNPDKEFAKMNECLALAYPPIELDFLNMPPVNHVFANLLPIRGALAETVMYDYDDDLEDDDDSVASLEDDDDSVASLEDDDVSLSKMTDVQIDEYIENLGREPREEIDEWTLNYEGGPILRYSYVNFATACLANQHVSNVTIRGANFTGATLRNYVFENVDFYECNFKNVAVDNVTFKNSTFVDTYLHPNTLESCHTEEIVIETY